MPIENPLVFYPRYLWEIVSKHVRLLMLARGYARMQARVKSDPARKDYMDLALTPVTEEELGELELFDTGEASRAAAEKRRQAQAKRPVKMAS